MKRVGSKQKSLFDYAFTKRSRRDYDSLPAKPAHVDHDHDYASVASSSASANPVHIAHDHDYARPTARISMANPVHIAHDHCYAPTALQTGGAGGLESSDDDTESPTPQDDDDRSPPPSPEEGEEDGPVYGPAPRPLEDYYEVLGERSRRVKQFGYSGWETTFVVKEEERREDPAETLRLVLQRFIDTALENSQEAGYSVDWMGLSFMTDEMRKGNGGKGQWLIPFKATAENNAEKILQEMENFDQSENSPELFGHAITLRVTTIKQPVGGAWDRRVRKAQIRRRPVDPSIVRIENTDNLCAFYAICVGRYYYCNGGGKWEKARRYARGHPIRSDARTLRWKAGVAVKALPQLYGLEDIDKVAKHLNQENPGRYRIVVFSDVSKTNAVYKSGQCAEHNICLY